MSINFTPLIAKYKEAISEMIDGVGKMHLLFFANTISGVNNDFFDITRDSADLKPSYKSTSTDSAPHTIFNGKIIQGLIKWDPEKYENFNIRVDSPESTIRIKSYLRDAADIQRADYIVPSITVHGVNSFLRTPINQDRGNVSTSGTNYTLWNDINGTNNCYIYQPISTKFKLDRVVTPRGLGSDEFLYSFWRQIS